MGHWMLVVRTLQGLDQLEFSHYIGRSRSAVNMYENGERTIPPDVIAAVRTSFPESPAPPMGEILPTSLALVEEIPKRWELPYAGIVPASSDWGDPLSQDEMKPVDPEFTGKGRFLCKIGGLSCYPALHEGDSTIWQNDRNPGPGVIVLAQRLGDSACTVKQLVYDETKGRQVLSAINPEYDSPPEGEGWEVVARLIGVIRRSGGPKRTWLWEEGLRPEHLAP